LIKVFLLVLCLLSALCVQSLGVRVLCARDGAKEKDKKEEE
jgi:hypothetical protein